MIGFGLTSKFKQCFCTKPDSALFGVKPASNDVHAVRDPSEPDQPRRRKPASNGSWWNHCIDSDQPMLEHAGDQLPRRVLVEPRGRSGPSPQTYWSIQWDPVRKMTNIIICPTWIKGKFVHPFFIRHKMSILPKRPPSAEFLFLT